MATSTCLALLGLSSAGATWVLEGEPARAGWTLCWPTEEVSHLCPSSSLVLGFAPGSCG